MICADVGHDSRRNEVVLQSALRPVLSYRYRVDREVGVAGIEPLAGNPSMNRWRLFVALAIAVSARAVFAAEAVDVTVDMGTLLRLDTNAKVVLVASPGSPTR